MILICAFKEIYTWYLVYARTSIPPLIGATSSITPILAILDGPATCHKKYKAIICKT